MQHADITGTTKRWIRLAFLSAELRTRTGIWPSFSDTGVHGNGRELDLPTDTL